MAIVHNKAAQYTRSQADDRVYRFCLLSLGIGFFFGLVIGLTVMTRQIWIWTVCAFIFCFTVLRFQRKLDEYLGRLGKERIRYLRGAQAESLVAWLLQGLNDDWHIFHGLQLQGKADTDHIVLGPNGLYCISTKSIRGLFNLAADGRVFYNNRPTELINDTMSQAMGLKDYLVSKLSNNIPFITPILAVPLAFTEFSGPQRGVWVLNQEQLVSVIEGGNKRVSKDQMAEILDVLKILTKRV